jgi:hypothetical protein
MRNTESSARREDRGRRDDRDVGGGVVRNGEQKLAQERKMVSIFGAFLGICRRCSKMVEHLRRTEMSTYGEISGFCRGRQPGKERMTVTKTKRYALEFAPPLNVSRGFSRPGEGPGTALKEGPRTIAGNLLSTATSPLWIWKCATSGRILKFPKQDQSQHSKSRNRRQNRGIG